MNIVSFQEMDVGDHLVLKAELNVNDPGKSSDTYSHSNLTHIKSHRATHCYSYISTTRGLLVHSRPLCEHIFMSQSVDKPSHTCRKSLEYSTTRWTLNTL